MKKKLFLLGVFLVATVVTCTCVYAQTLVDIKINGTYNNDKSNEVFSLVNQERAKAGISSLEYDKALAEKANLRAREIALYFSHTRPNGENVLKSMKLNGENIAAGSSTATGVMNQWMNSTGHKNNILSSYFKSIGIGSYTTENNVTYWVQVFSAGKSGNSNKLIGTVDKESEIVSIKLANLKQLSILDLKNNKKIEPDEEYTIKELNLRNEGWDAVTTTISNQNAKWSSSNPLVATIDKDGKIKGISAGTTTITAKVAGMSVSYPVEVKFKEINITKVELNKNKINLKVGESDKLTATIIPTNTTNDKTLTFKSDDLKIATVDKYGVVTAKGEGSAIISVLTSNRKMATCIVEVKKSESSITSINIKNTKTNLYVGEELKLIVEKEPSNAKEFITWTSSDKGIATVDKNGIVKANGFGKVIIYAKAGNASASIEITVKNKEEEIIVKPEQPKEKLIERVSLNCQDLTLKIGETFHFDYRVYPEDATESANPTWVGMYYKMAELGRDNVLVAKQAGEGDVKVIVGKNNLVATCHVKVVATNEVKSISVSDAYKLKVGEARVLNAEVYPKDAMVYGTIKWTSSNPDILTINEKTGVIFANKKGTVVVSATAPNGVKGVRTLTIE